MEIAFLYTLNIQILGNTYNPQKQIEYMENTSLNTERLEHLNKRHAAYIEQANSMDQNDLRERLSDMLSMGNKFTKPIMEKMLDRKTREEMVRMFATISLNVEVSKASQDAVREALQEVRRMMPKQKPTEDPKTPVTFSQAERKGA